MISKTQSIKINGAEYPMAWGKLALARYSSIPIEQRNLIGPARLAQIIWSAYRGVVHPYSSWEPILGFIVESSESDANAIDIAIGAILPEPQSDKDKEKKPVKEPSESEKKSGLIESEPLQEGVSG